MFDQLITRSQELRPRLQETLSEPIELNIIQGAILEVDHYWLSMFIVDHFGPWSYFRPGIEHEHWLSVTSLSSSINWNFDYRPRKWDQHCSVMGLPENSNPLIIRVILNRELEHRKSIQQEWDLPRVFDGYPLIYESRPALEEVHLLSGLQQSIQAFFNKESYGMSKSISVGRATPKPTAGTLGGFLRSRDGNTQYFVSCAHVLGDEGTIVYSPGPFENQGLNAVGLVRFSEIPSLQVAGTNCNIFTAPTARGLDVAVAEVFPEAIWNNQPTALPKLSTVRNPSSMTPFQPVSFSGKVSGPTSAYLGGCTIWHSIKSSDGFRCFGTLFEIVAPTGSPLPLARHGDSGAWVVDGALGSAYCWNGMVISAVPNRDRAYCCFAQHILDACDKNLWPALSLAV